MKHRLFFIILLVGGYVNPTPTWAQDTNTNGQLPNEIIEQLWQLTSVTLLVYLLTSIIKTLSDNRLKRLLIEKGLAANQVKYLFGQDPRVSLLQSLRYGLLALGIGGGLWVNHFLPFGLITFGLIGIGASIGFLLYVIIAYQLIKRNPVWHDNNNSDDVTISNPPPSPLSK